MWRIKKNYQIITRRVKKKTPTVSLVFVICVLPFHHVIVGEGRAPTTSHHKSYELPADNGRFSPWSFTHNGRTMKI